MADQNNPWDTTPAADSAAQSADAWGTPTTAPTDGGGADWLTSTPAPNVEHFNILDPFHKTLIPLDSWVTEGIDWVVTHFRPVFQGVRVPVDYILNGFQQLLLGMPAPVAIIVFALIAWQISGVGMGVATLVSLIAIGAIGAWSQAMVTLALVLTALLFCIVIGLPLGIWLARSPRAAKIIRPLLDAMQTTPAFVYLVPIVMLFGIGNVPGVVVTIIFALPPIIRLTILGINQVPADRSGGVESPDQQFLATRKGAAVERYSCLADINCRRTTTDDARFYWPDAARHAAKCYRRAFSDARCTHAS